MFPSRYRSSVMLSERSSVDETLLANALISSAPHCNVDAVIPTSVAFSKLRTDEPECAGVLSHPTDPPPIVAGFVVVPVAFSVAEVVFEAVDVR